MLSKPIYLRRLVRGAGDAAEHWSLYRHRGGVWITDRMVARAGYAVCSGAGSGPAKLDHVERDYGTDVGLEIEALVARKLAEGFVEVSERPWHGGRDSPLRRALEDALAEGPEDLAAHMAYADHQQELGHPRGEL